MAHQSPQQRKLDRRTFLTGVAAASGVGLTGCLGDDEDLGERVPTVVLEYAPDAGGVSEMMEDSIPTIRDNIEELGIDLEVSPVSISENIGNVVGDTRTMDIWMIFNTGSLDNLDPQEYLFRYHISQAGGGAINQANWANCEYSQLVTEQQFVPDPDEREEVVTDALQVLGENHVLCPLYPIEVEGAANTDRVNVGELGSWGLVYDFPLSMLEAEPTEGNELRTSGPIPIVERKNFTQVDFTIPFLMWNLLVHSTLIEYDKDFNIEPSLARDWEVDGDNLIFELHEDATFHNGDPITPEDVKFTYEFIDQNHGQIFKAVETPLNEVIIVDEHTVEFDYAEAYAPAVGRDLPAFGVLHKDTWEEAEGNLAEFEPDPLIGSGPYELDQFESGEFLALTPHDGHPKHSADHDIIIIAYADEVTAFEAFNAGEIDVIEEISPAIRRDIAEMDDAELFPFPGTLPMNMNFQTPHPPSKFHAFRLAVGRSINRNLLNQIIYDGEGEEPVNSIIFQPNHPSWPDGIDVPGYTDDPTGDIEGARAHLEAEGWGWDGNDNLHYPPDVDLSEQWPAEERPNPDDFECLDDDGRFIRT